MMVTGRKWLTRKGVLSHTGLLDPDYGGKFCALLYNTSKEAFQVSKGQQVAQAILLQVCEAQWKKTDILSETERQDKGFGSTDHI